MLRKPSLLPEKIKLFIGGRNAENGRFTTHLTRDMRPESLQDWLIEHLELNLPSEDKADPEYYLLEIKATLNYFLQNIVNIIKLENNILLQNILDYDKEGIFRLFAMSYERINTNSAKVSDNLEAGLARVFAHYFKEFINTDDFVISTNNYNSRINSNIKNIDNNFSIIINVLLMSIFCDFHAYPNSFDTGKVLCKDIAKIKEKLLNMLEKPNNRRTSSLTDFLIHSRHSHPENIKKFNLVTGSSISDTDIIEFIFNKTKEGKREFIDLREYHSFHFELSTSFDDHYISLLDMIGIINLVETVYLHYHDVSSGRQTSEGTPIGIFLMLENLQLT